MASNQLHELDAGADGAIPETLIAQTEAAIVGNLEDDAVPSRERPQRRRQYRTSSYTYGESSASGSQSVFPSTI